MADASSAATLPGSPVPSGKLSATDTGTALPASAGFATARDKGPNAFGMFSCSKQSTEMNYIAQKFARVAMHRNNIDSCNRT